MKKISLLFFLCLCAFAVNVSAQPTPLGAYGTISWTQMAALPTTTGGTLAVYYMVGPKSITLSGASTLKLPTAVALCSGFPTVAAQGTFFSWDWAVFNNSSGANTLTIQLNDGVTDVTTFGTMTVVQNAVKRFKVSITGCNTSAPKAVVYSLGTAVF